MSEPTRAASWCASPWRGLDELTVTPEGAGLTVTAVTTVLAADNPYLAAHFPGLTILPGVFVLEAVRQAVIEAFGKRDGRSPTMLELSSARFLRPLRAGERMLLTASVRAEPESDRLRVDARCWRVDGPLTAMVRALFGWLP